MTKEFDAGAGLGHALRIEDVPGSSGPVSYHLAETIDGIYTPYALRTPAGDGPFPFLFLAYGNGGGGLGWLRERMRTHGYVMERFLDAGYACAWARYRSEVELGFGDRLIVDRRQGMDLLNRAPLEYEDEIAIINHVKANPLIDAERIGHVGVSHAGEMLFKINSHYPGAIRAGVACEPANHEFLDLSLDNTVTVNPQTQLRALDDMQMRDPGIVRTLINLPLARERIAPITSPMLVMGRDHDHLQGIFRLSYELLAEADKVAEWVSWDHPLHGYIFPTLGADGTPDVDRVQDRAIDGILDFLNKHLDFS